MKTTIKQLWYIMVPAGLLLNACGKCESCATIYTVQGAALKMGDTNLRLDNVSDVAVISAERIVTKRDGDHKCRNTTETSCIEDGLDPSLLSIYCTKDLVLGSGTIAAGTNLLAQKALLDTQKNDENVPHILLQAAPGFPAGRYSFILRGTTKEGKEVEDIGWVNWE